MKGFYQEVEDDRDEYLFREKKLETSAENISKIMCSQLARTRNLLKKLNEQEHEFQGNLRAIEASLQATTEESPEAIHVVLYVAIQTEALKCLNILINLPAPPDLVLSETLERIATLSAKHADHTVQSLLEQFAAIQAFSAELLSRTLDGWLDG
ncbi:hypothetical protein AAF712_002568 [Marasmius tenuissimus]|uniref:Uncharacterized protein n=1 Tax=Marasmius tenuissimus TaxID=585030 RepID=A0ABR3ACS9_9AGAR